MTANGARGCAWLQWGRNLTVAEGGPHDPYYMPMGKLQWGRNLTVAEGGEGGKSGGQ